MIVGFTGHRKLQHSEMSLARATIRWLKVWKPDQAITGMALGYDQLAARVCVYLSIPFIAALPAKEQPDVWSTSQKRIYYKILERASKVVYVDTVPGYDRSRNFIGKLFVRNRWIVDNSDKLLSYYIEDGKFKGGTYSAICYAHSKMKMVIPLILQGPK